MLRKLLRRGGQILSRLLYVRNHGKLTYFKPYIYDCESHVFIKNYLILNKPWSNNLYKHCRRLGSISIAKGAKLICDSFVAYDGVVISIQTDAILKLGTNSYINSNSSIHCFKSITIGDNVVISENCVIRDSDNHTILRQGFELSEPIHIGNHVWIGLNSVILKGVSLGDGCIVAAGSVVTKSFPPNCLIGGVPAKVLKENVQWI